MMNTVIKQLNYSYMKKLRSLLEKQEIKGKYVKWTFTFYKSFIA